MGALADSLFSVLMSWVRALVNAIWALFSTERTTILEFLGKNWIGLAVLIIAAGLVIDWLIWLIRWQPYHIWAMRVRRLLRIAPPQEEEAQEEAPPQEIFMPPEPRVADEQDEQWMPLPQPVIGEEEAQEVLDAAEQVPDASLGQYPGRRYDSSAAAQEELGDTRRFGAVHAEGPGAAEVNRRRTEIDAWQTQMQEEARQKAQAERAARQAEAERARAEREAREAEQARLVQEAYEAEQARLAQEAYEVEQTRLAQEAYEAEQARLAQEEYERQLAEYERQRAQYELELAEYERKKAEYDAAIAAQQAAERAAQETVVQTEFAQENPQSAQVGGVRRRRRNTGYSDYVEGEAVSELPAPPEWTQLEQVKAPELQSEEAPKAGKRSFLRSGMAKMAQMIEPEHEDVMGIASLPPRVDMHEAYKPAKRPKKTEQ